MVLGQPNQCVPPSSKLTLWHRLTPSEGWLDCVTSTNLEGNHEGRCGSAGLMPSRKLSGVYIRRGG